MGVLVGAVQRTSRLTTPLAIVGVVFVLLQVLSPIHQAVGANLGSRTAAWLYDQLTAACVRPPGMGHLENPALTSDLTMARDFDLGISGPPHVDLDGLHRRRAGRDGGRPRLGRGARRPTRGGRRCCSPAHGSRRTGCCARAPSGATGTPKRCARRSAHADYAYRLAVDPPAAKELRLFGLADWVVERFRSRRRRLFELRWQATRLRERPVLWSLLLVLAANVVVFWSLGAAAADGALSPRQAGDLRERRGEHQHDRVRRTVVGARRRGRAGRGGAAASGGDGSGGCAGAAAIERPRACRRARSGFATSRSPIRPATSRCSRASISTIPAGSSLAIVGQNGAGKTTLAKLLCRLYDPQAGAIEVDGVDLRELDLDAWRSRVTAVFQDFIRFELPLRDNVAPAGAPDDVDSSGARRGRGVGPRRSRHDAGARLPGRHRSVRRPVAAHRAGARAVRGAARAPGVVLLDEPTAQLDVRGEAEIFERILAATRHTTTILISHRFSTVRHADRICVLEHGRVVELGTHDELMAAGGRYRTMFELQASRFGEDGEQEGRIRSFDVLDCR